LSLTSLFDESNSGFLNRRVAKINISPNSFNISCEIGILNDVRLIILNVASSELIAVLAKEYGKQSVSHLQVIIGVIICQS